MPSIDENAKNKKKNPVAPAFVRGVFMGQSIYVNKGSGVEYYSVDLGIQQEGKAVTFNVRMKEKLSDEFLDEKNLKMVQIPCEITAYKGDINFEARPHTEWS